MADLVVLYQKMSDLTRPICMNGQGDCARFTTPYRCCAQEHCERAARFTREKYGLELQPTGHPSIPFMGSDGCTVAPHLRPHCTFHLCSVSYSAVSTASPAYLELRDRILAQARAEGKDPL